MSDSNQISNNNLDFSKELPNSKQCQYKLVVFNWKGTLQPPLGRGSLKEVTALSKMEQYLKDALGWPEEKIENFKTAYQKIAKDNETKIPESGIIYHAKNETMIAAFNQFNIASQDDRLQLKQLYYEGYTSLHVRPYDGISHAVSKKHKIWARPTSQPFFFF